MEPELHNFADTFLSWVYKLITYLGKFVLLGLPHVTIILRD
jgi:hypothetical protein